MVCGYVLLFLLDIKVENRLKYMFKVRLASNHLYGKWLFTWLLPVAGDILDGVLFCAVLFLTRCLG